MWRSGRVCFQWSRQHISAVTAAAARLKQSVFWSTLQVRIPVQTAKTSGLVPLPSEQFGATPFMPRAKPLPVLPPVQTCCAGRGATAPCAATHWFCTGLWLEPPGDPRAQQRWEQELCRCRALLSLRTHSPLPAEAWYNELTHCSCVPGAGTELSFSHRFYTFITTYKRTSIHACISVSTFLGTCWLKFGLFGLSQPVLTIAGVLPAGCFWHSLAVPTEHHLNRYS